MTRDGEWPEVPGFSIRGRIGSGATATVWWAQDRDTGEAFALKVANRVGVSQGADEAASEAREIGLLRRLEHPHIVRLHRVVDLPDGRRALVLTLAALSMRDLMAQRRTFCLAEVVGIVSPVAGALAHLHARGIVHGDVAPGNILLTEQGSPILADLGVARVLGGGPSRDAEPSFETPGFGAPELRQGAAPLAASDVWSLGRILHSLGGNAAAARPVETDPLFQLVTACTAPDPAARPTAAVVERVLRLAARAVPLEPPPAPPPERAVTRRAGARSGGQVPVPRRSDDECVTNPRRFRVRGLGRLGGLGALGGLMVILLSVSGAVAWAQTGPNATQTGGKDGSARRIEPVSSASPVRSPREDDPVAAVGDIAAERAAALAAASITRLGSVDVAGSPAWRADVALIRELRGEGVRLTGLRFSVDEARLVHWAEDAALVRVSMVASEHRRSGPRGPVIVPAERADPVDLVLVRISSGGWRLRSIEPVPGPGSAGSGSGT